MKNVFQTKASTIKIQISAPDAYYNSKFFLQALAGCGRLKEVRNKNFNKNLLNNTKLLPNTTK